MKLSKPYNPTNLRPSLVKRNLSKYKKIAFVVLLTLMVALTVAWFRGGGADSFGKVESVEVHGDGKYVSNQDVASVVENKIKGKNIYLLKENDLEKLITSNFLAVKGAEIIKEGRKVIVSLKERTPIVVLSVGEPPVYYLADIEGYILGQVEAGSINLPEVKFNKPELKIGSFLERSKVSLYIKIIEALKEDNLQVSTLVSDEAFLSFYTGDHVLVYISFDKDIRTSAKLLKEVLLKFKLDNIILKKVDLRYDNVVVEY